MGKPEWIRGWIGGNGDEEIMGARLCRHFGYFCEWDLNPLEGFGREVI